MARPLQYRMIRRKYEIIWIPTFLVVLLEVSVDAPNEVHKQAPRILTDCLPLFPLKFDPGVKIVVRKLRWVGCGRCGGN